jgi:hypothetical protein
MARLMTVLRRTVTVVVLGPAQQQFNGFLYFLPGAQISAMSQFVGYDVLVVFEVLEVLVLVRFVVEVVF